MALYKAFTIIPFLYSCKVDALAGNSLVCLDQVPDTSPVCSTPINSQPVSLQIGSNMVQNPSFQTGTGTDTQYSTDGWGLCSSSPYSTIESAPGYSLQSNDFPAEINGYSIQLGTNQNLLTTVEIYQTINTFVNQDYEFKAAYKVSNTVGTTVSCGFDNVQETKISVSGNQLSLGWSFLYGQIHTSSGLTKLTCQLRATATTKANFDRIVFAVQATAT